MIADIGYWRTRAVHWRTEIGRGVGYRDSSLTERDSSEGTEIVPSQRAIGHGVQRQFLDRQR